MRHILALSLIAFTSVSIAAPVPPPDKLLAADALALVTITDYKKARAEWDRWPMVKLWNDTAMKAFREKLDTKLKADLIEPLEREFGIKFADYKDLAQGQITLALTRGTPTDQGVPTLGFFFVVDTKDKSEALKTNLVALKNKWVESGKAVKNEKIRDIDFTTLIFSGDDIAKNVDKVLPSPKKDKEAPEERKPAKKHEWIVGQSDSLLIVATSAKDVEKILIRQSGGTVPSLSEYGPFAANYGTFFRDTLTYAWIDLKSTFEFTSSKPKKTEEDPEETGIDQTKFLNAIGVGALQSLALTLKDSNEGCLFTGALTAPESARRGLVRILSHEARDAGPPAFVPHDTVKLTRWRLDLPKTWTLLESMLVDINPAYAGIIKLFVENAGKDKDPNFDLRKSLIANLGDDLIIYEKKPKEATLAAMDKPPTLYLVGSPRAEQAAAAVKSLTAFLPQPSRFKEREFLGRKVFSVTLPAAPVEQGAGGAGRRPEERVLSYVASGSYLAFSTDTVLLEEYLRAADARPLRELPGLAAAAEKVGGMGSGLFGFENQQESMRVIFDALKKDAASIDDLLSGSRIAGKLAGDEDKKFKAWFDFSLLPEFDRVAKYFHIAVWSGSVTTDGITFKWFSPMPPGAK